MLFETPQTSDRAVALGLGVVISAIFVIAAPFATVPLVRIPAFIAVYESAVIINDLVTAAVIAALFVARGSRRVLFLAAGYLWTALLAAAHMLSFPGLLTASGLFSGPQTTAWIYVIWHIGFPTAVIFYAVADSSVIRLRWRALIIAGLAVAIAVAGLVGLSTGGHDLLPVIMDAHHEKPLASLICGGLCLVAAFAMGRVLGGSAGALTRLDLSLAIVMYAWIGDIILSGVVNAGRFDLGFYAGRFFGFLAVSFVLYQMLLLAVVEHYRHARW